MPLVLCVLEPSGSDGDADNQWPETWKCHRERVVDPSFSETGLEFCNSLV